MNRKKNGINYIINGANLARHGENNEVRAVHPRGYTKTGCFIYTLLFIPHFYPVPHFGVARRSLRRSAKIVLGQSADSLNPYQ
jgi:hypothetical protein